MEICCCVLQNDQMRQDLTEYKLQLQSQRNMMVARAEDTDIQNKLMKKNKDLAEAMEELQVYSKTSINRPLSKRQKLVFKTNYSLMQREHSAILSTFIKLPFVIKTFVLSIFEWPFYTGFTVYLTL